MSSASKPTHTVFLLMDYKGTFLTHLEYSYTCGKQIKNLKSYWLACFLVSSFSLFSSMICKGQQETRIRVPEWKLCRWFWISNCCFSDCRRFLEPHPEKKVGLTPFCYRSLPDQCVHLCCQNQDSQGFRLSFTKGPQHKIASPIPLLLLLLYEYTDMPKYLCMFSYFHICTDL